MPRPAEHPDWATAPSSPTDIVRPPAARIADGWNPAEKPPAQFFNWWQNLSGLWTRWFDENVIAFEARLHDIERRIVADEWTYPAPKLRTIVLMPEAGVDATISTAAPGWTRTSISVIGGAIYSPLRSNNASSRWLWQLQLPTGSRLVRIRALLQPGAARSGAADRTLMRFFSTQLGFAPALGPSGGIAGASIRDDGSTNAQALDTGPISHAIDNASRVYYVEVRGGTTAGDLVYGLQVQFDDPGPRNN